jgi:uncharacterized membrane protein
MDVQALLHNPYVAAAITGIIAAAIVDVRAFQSWKSANEALSYDWKVAGWRWFQGAVMGMVTAFGISLT